MQASVSHTLQPDGSRILETRVVPLVEATPAALAGCGELLGRHPGAEPLPIQFYKGSVQTYRPVDFRSDEQTELSLAHVRRRPFEVHWIERHFKHTQTFIPLGGAPFIAVLAPPTDGDLPDLETVRAYRFDGTAGFTMKLGTWHEFPFAVEDEADIVVILRREATQSLLDTDPATGEVRGPDIQKQDLIKQHGVQLKFNP